MRRFVLILLSACVQHVPLKSGSTGASNLGRSKRDAASKTSYARHFIFNDFYSITSPNSATSLRRGLQVFMMLLPRMSILARDGRPPRPLTLSS